MTERAQPEPVTLRDQEVWDIIDALHYAQSREAFAESKRDRWRAIIEKIVKAGY